MTGVCDALRYSLIVMFMHIADITIVISRDRINNPVQRISPSAAFREIVYRFFLQIMAQK